MTITKRIATFLLFFSGLSSALYSRDQHIITFFIRYEKEQPKSADEINAALQKTVSSPEKLGRRLMKHNLGLRPVAGVYATYGGFVAHSTADGQIVLPRKHPEDELIIAITPVVRPVIIHGQTVQFFAQQEEVPGVFYRYTRMTDARGALIWKVEKIAPPKNNQIPSLAIIIPADPETIVVEEGIFPADAGPNLILPPLLATKRFSRNLNALLLLRIGRYFSLTDYLYEKKPDRFSKITTA